MPLYRYKACREGMPPVRGRVSASSPEEALAQLRAKGLFVTALRKEGLSLFKAHPFRKSLRLSRFCRTWSSLLSAGLPLMETLSLMESQEGRQGGAILSHVAAGIETGQSLTASFRGSGEFPLFFLAMLSVGERSGTLPEQLLTLSCYYEKEQKLRQNLRNAAAYPVFLLCASLLVCAAVLTVILPAFARLFENLGMALPLPAQAALETGIFLRHTGPWLFAAVLAAVLFLSLRRRSERGRLQIDRFWLRPLFLRRLVLIRFCRAMDALLQSGSPLSDALESAAAVMGNHSAAASAMDVAAAVRQGGSFPDALERSPFSMPLLSRMAKAGMESGKLPEFLLRTASLLTEEEERALARFQAAAGPVLITAAGLFTAAIVLSVMIPLFSAVSGGLP